MSTESIEIEIEIMGRTEIKKVVELYSPCGSSFVESETYQVEVTTSYTTTVFVCRNSVHADEMFITLAKAESIMDKESPDEPEDYAGQTVGETIVKIEAAKDDSLLTGFATLTALHANLNS